EIFIDSHGSIVQHFVEKLMQQSYNCHIRIVPFWGRNRSAGALLRLKESPMPDLDQIKQGEQGVREAEKLREGRDP
ncbi:MAG TPA: hypothetical protein VH230_03380, partial [Stellaceae bacterium]|nr:hypothetical protein [Stellaceae bacterium]